MVTKIISLGEALRNNSNPHNFKRKQTQVFAKLSLHSLLPERWNLVCFFFVCLSSKDTKLNISEDTLGKKDLYQNFLYSLKLKWKTF